MRKFIGGSVIIFFIIFSGNVKGEFYESRILDNGGSKSIGLGNANVAYAGDISSSINSPASPALIEIPSLSFTYGDLLGFNNYLYITYTHPTLYGNFTGNIRYFNANDTTIGLSDATHLNLNFSKIFTDKLFVGFGVNFLSGAYADDRGVIFGLNLGAIYNIYAYNIDRSKEKLENIRIGFSILNIGNPIIDNNDVAISPSFELKLGPSIMLNLFKNIKTVFNAEMELKKMKDFQFNIGMENIIKGKLAVRLGYDINSEFQNFSGGIGYKFLLKNINSEIYYTLLSEENNKLTHYLGIDMAFGTIDKEPPETRIELNLKYFSPNYDGNSDYLDITPTIKDNRLLKGWDIKIVNGNGEVVQEYKSPDIDILRGKLTLKKVLTRLFEKKKEATVPDKIVWDGVDKNGKMVPDGKYKVIATAYDEKLNKSKPVISEVIVDKTPPTIDISMDYKIFSPNGDNNKDTVKFNLNIKCDPSDEWSTVIKDAKGKVIRKYFWKGERKEIVWDGKDDNNNLAPDGNYTFEITGKDKAGNKVTKSIKGITLTTAARSVAISANLDEFSPNGDGLLDEVTFTPYVSDSRGLETWRLDIMDKDGNIVKEFKGENKVPEEIVWDGKDNSDNILPDGVYLYKFSATYDAGNFKPSSFPLSIKIDTTAPETKLSILPDIFSPDGDGEDDICKFDINYKDKSDIKNWSLIIYEKGKDGVKEFKKFEKKGSPAKEIIWNGLSDDGKLVQSKNKYYVDFMITDAVGNKKEIKNKDIKISTTPPDVDFEFEPKLFSPDGDGENDLLYIKIFTYDKRKIKKWVLNIYPIREGKRESLFKQFKGNNIPTSNIVWNGKSDKGELVESAMDYDIELIVTDILGNIKKVTKRMSVDVLVIKTPYGLKIKISNIEFEYNKARLRGNAFDILDKVTKILDKYSNYKVIIVGYTDSIGSEEYNLKLSERRAKAVYDYLVDNGIDANRLTSLGKGEANPVAPNTNPDGSDNPEGRAKNRRVEFLLIKPGHAIPDEAKK